MVLPNMMAESGAKNAYLTPDERVFEWVARRLAARSGVPLRRVPGPASAEALYPDPDAEYIATLEVDLGGLEPLVACPHSPANGAPLSQVAGTPVQQAFIGTCTNGRLEDLAEAAAVLRDTRRQGAAACPGNPTAGDPGLQRGAAGSDRGGLCRHISAKRGRCWNAGLRSLHGQSPRRAGSGRDRDQHRQPQLPGQDGEPGERRCTWQARRWWRQAP